MIEKHVEIIKELNFKPKTVLEIGSRDGKDANYYKEQFNLLPTDIHIVEPNPIMYDEISKNYPNTVRWQYAIDVENGIKEFNQVIGGGYRKIGVSSLFDRIDDFYTKHETNKILVETRTGYVILDCIGEDIDICKIDVEGMSYQVLVSMDNLISKIKTLHIEAELRELWKGQKLYDDVHDFLINNNFELVWNEKVCYGLQMDSIWINKNLKTIAN